MMLGEESVIHYKREKIYQNGRTDNLNGEYCCCKKSEGSNKGPDAHFN